MTKTTEQEIFWKGEFGSVYADRNRGESLVASNLALFSKVLDSTREVRSVLEFGSNIGLNLLALRQLLPKSELSAVEINEKAASELKQNIPEVNLHVASIIDFEPSSTWDLVFTKGVLIHINPSKLPVVYESLYRSSSRYIAIAEYYDTTPTSVTYRGHKGMLFKRDFAGEILNMFPNLFLVNYGFVYHGDPRFPQDDLTWFLMEKI